MPGSLLEALRSAWPLLFGIALLMLGNGLQGTLLGIRAGMEGFETTMTGIIMTGYFVGFLAGSVVVPRLLARVGHVRVFAALASLASASPLLHSVFLNPLSWIAMRLLTGFCFAGLYVVAESWLNERATNATRGQLLAIYMIVTLGGMACGQLLLNIADPGGHLLFILVAVLISVALVPIALSAVTAPSFEAPAHVTVIELFRVSPLGIVGCVCVGTVHAALFGMGAVYARAIGMGVEDTSYFMASALFGAIILQWPLGRLSDRIDRRVVIAAVTLTAALLAFAAIPVSGVSRWGLVVLFAVFGGLSLSLYSLCLAYTNDYLEPEQVVAASATLVLLTGVGATFGPSLAALFMAWISPAAFFGFLGVMHALLGLFAVYRMSIRSGVSTEDQTPYAPVPPRASPIAATLPYQDLEDEEEPDEEARWSNL